MRDILVFAAVFGLLPFILRNPYVGVLTWSWLSYMNPHRLTWGPAYSFPFAQLVAGTLLVSLFLDKEKKRFPMNGLVGLWIVFLIWTVITSATAIYPDRAWDFEIQIFKIQIIIFLSLWIMGSDHRIKLMVWVIFFSIGFFGIKGGIFTLTTGGVGRVYGPAGSFIDDNNHLAVAMLMVLPLGFYLRKHEVTKTWQKHAMTAALLLVTLSVIASYSRGAFLAIAAVAVYLWWKTPGKALTGMVGVVVLAVLVLFMPQSWHDRMSSIGDYENDASSQERLNSWGYSISIANDRLTGGGYRSWSRKTFKRWAKNPNIVFVAHSIYFSVLADHGWPGLIMFFLLFVGGWRYAGRVSRFAAQSQHEDAPWIYDLANMIRVSIVAYAVGGAFLSLSYFDLPWHLLAIIVLLERSAKEKGILSAKNLSYAEQRKMVGGMA